jgi:hypothetical protein
LAVLFAVKEMDFALQSTRRLLSSLELLQPKRRELMKIDHLRITLTQAVTTFVQLQTLVCPFDSEADVTPPISLRVKWINKEEEVSGIVQRLEGHKSSISLLLNILQWYVVALMQLSFLLDVLCSANPLAANPIVKL